MGSSFAEESISNDLTATSTSPVDKFLLIVSLDLSTTLPTILTTVSGLAFSTSLKKSALFSVTHWVKP